MKRVIFSLLFLTMVSLPLIGCGEGTDGKTDQKSGKGKADPAAAHSHEPQHGGHLIELGNDHSIHAELVDAHELGGVAIYMMDGDFKPMKIEQESITLILSKGDEHKEFELKAKDGKPADIFLSKDSALHDMMHGEGVTGKLKATIKGKQYNGKVDLGSHAGHSHD